MSNEFVMIPRVPTDEMVAAFAEVWYSKRQTIDAPDMLDAYAAMLAVAPEHQGEAVALPERKPWNGLLATADNLKGSGWNACLDEIAKLGPLYTCADPGEFERLRAQLAAWQALAAERLELMAERDALIARVVKSGALTPEKFEELEEKCCAPVEIGQVHCTGHVDYAPVERDERAAFEKHYGPGTWGHVNWSVELQAWQARAALERK